ncbi:hypothetical protein MRX96_015269 [Rhipicephalus microplus]|uniref:Uncharacterized protein n=1 Tax=Rhipicephalus microplus TaxID=6941 RepID=A0A9J6DBA3_RHIMP|nr:hypothetical protein HPB51_018811 [Rhipicephalus microplus]
MERNDCGFLLTSVESVGLGMDMRPTEKESFCNMWGWIVRIFYAFYLASRVTYYLLFVKDNVDGRLDELRKYTGPIILDAVFLLALYVNYKLGVHSGSVREVLREFPGGLPGNPRVAFARRITQATALLWLVAISLSVFAHASATLPDELLERVAVVTSFYVDNVFAFGTMCFTAAMLGHLSHYLGFELLKYEKALVQLFHRPPAPHVHRLVLGDFYALRQLMRNVAAAFDGVALVWFLAGALYLLHTALQWALAPSDAGTVTASALRGAVLWVLLLFASDRASVLRRRTEEIRRFLKTAAGSLASSNPDASSVLSDFQTDCFSKPMGISVACGMPFTRAFFCGSVLLALVASCAAGSALYVLT